MLLDNEAVVHFGTHFAGECMLLATEAARKDKKGSVAASGKEG
jgi:hypothetical protein